METDTKLAYILQNKDEHKIELIRQLVKDSDLQRAAVGTLLERGDARSWGLLQQIRLVETQLAMLTIIELDKKKLQIDQHMVSIVRIALYTISLLFSSSCENVLTIFML